MLAAALPHRECDLVRLRALDKPDVHVDVADVLDERPPRAGHLDLARLDLDVDALGDLELFGLEDVPHLWDTVSTTYSLDCSSREGIIDGEACAPARKERRVAGIGVGITA